MYRTLFIETGDYLYCSETAFGWHLYSKYEVDMLIKSHTSPSLKIYEVPDREEAVKKLTDEILTINVNNTVGIKISTNLNLFEIVEV